MDDPEPNHCSGPKNSPLLLPDVYPEPVDSLQPEELLREVPRVRTCRVSSVGQNLVCLMATFIFLGSSLLMNISLAISWALSAVRPPNTALMRQLVSTASVIFSSNC